MSAAVSAPPSAGDLGPSADDAAPHGAEPAGTDPESLYARELEDRRRYEALWSRRERSISFARLAVMIALLVTAWLAVQNRIFSAAWILLPLGLFLALLLLHRRVLGSLERSRSAARHFELGLARITDEWPGSGDAGERYRPNRHLYAQDLDIFGRGSLFELLATAQSVFGRDTLAAWLLDGAQRDEVIERQQAVAELRPDWGTRERLAVMAPRTSDDLDGEVIRGWAAVDIQPPRSWVRPALAGLAAAQVFALVAWLALGWGPTLLLGLLLLHTVAAILFRRQQNQALQGLDRAARQLEHFGELLEVFAAAKHESPKLARLTRSLLEGDRAAAVEIRRLRRIAELLDSRRNPFFAPIAILVLWTPLLAVSLQTWRARCGGQLRSWLEVAGELEALVALAGYAFEHPADPFPELLQGDEPRLSAAGLRHPLLPSATCVPNDVALGPGRRVLLISGSNMSGKSTYLRTVGCNVVLASMGAPVRAESMTLAPFRLGASIQVVDSLQEGSSRFYAEITRLREILELASGPAPTLFLLDEILHGTNSHDRRIGAAAVVRSLRQRGAVGMVTTHDLALARIAEEPELEAVTVHFQDEIEGGEMVFDYRLHDGVVTKSNAIELMRRVGLEV